MSLIKVIDFIRKGISAKAKMLKEAFKELFGDLEGTYFYTRCDITGIRKEIRGTFEGLREVAEMLKEFGYNIKDNMEVDVIVEVEEPAEGSREEKEPKTILMSNGVDVSQYIRTSAGLVFVRVLISWRYPDCCDCDC